MKSYLWYGHVIYSSDRLLQCWCAGLPGACPGGGAQGAWPPPLEIEKQKKKKKVIRANIKLFHLYFATFLVENVIFSASFWAGPPPWKIEKQKKKKKKAFRFWAPPLTNSWTRTWLLCKDRWNCRYDSAHLKTFVKNLNCCMTYIGSMFVRRWPGNHTKRGSSPLTVQCAHTKAHTTAHTPRWLNTGVMRCHIWYWNYVPRNCREVFISRTYNLAE